MAYTTTWDAAFQATPADIDDISDGATKIRQLKVSVSERMAKDHYFDLTGTDADHGEHVKCTLRKQTSKPTAVADKGYVYTKIVGSHVELFYEDEAGSELQLTANGTINATIPVKAAGSELDTGTDDAKFATAKALVDSHNVPSVAPGTSGNVLTSNGTDWTSTALSVASGSVVQVVNYQTNSYSTGSTYIPVDNTIPQSSEGTQVMTLAITPTSATNKLLITVVALMASSGAGHDMVAALFQGTTADALAASTGDNAYYTGYMAPIVFSYYMTSGTTSSITFKVRVGSDSSGISWYFNGGNSARRFGGAAYSP